MCPNSSLSISSPGIAAQFTSTNGLLARGDSRWIARATSSLPVPFSPVMSTRASVGATFSMLLHHLPHGDARPTISWRRLDRRRAAARSPPGARAAASALRSISRMRSVSSGFSRNSYAPRRVASTAVSIVPWPLIITTIGRGIELAELASAPPARPCRAIFTSMKVEVRPELGVEESASPAPPAERTSCPSYSSS